MKFTEAMSKFGNSRRRLAEALGLSTQAVSKWAKNPDENIPKKRIAALEKILNKWGELSANKKLEEISTAYER